jgi:hypothetical protein
MNFSPSIYHQALGARTEQALRYRGGDVLAWQRELKTKLNLLQVAEMGDLCGLIAPKPLVIVSGREDGIFPLHAAESEFARVRDIYQAVGASDRCHHVIGEGGHRFYADDAWPVMMEELETGYR